jgi:hypothetical protein
MDSTTHAQLQGFPVAMLGSPQILQQGHENSFLHLNHMVKNCAEITKGVRNTISCIFFWQYLLKTRCSPKQIPIIISLSFGITLNSIKYISK